MTRLKTPPTPAVSAASKPQPAEGPQVESLAARCWNSTFAVALVGSLLMWAALPPLELAPLAWLAPVPWLLLAQRREMPGRRPYRALWLASFVFWLLAIHWLRLPHPSTYAGWIALSAWLACFLPVFVALVRVAVKRWKLSLLIAAPVVWTGLDLAKAHLLSGFTIGSLGHSQFRWPALIQFADVVGVHGLGGLVVLVAAGFARSLPLEGRRFAWWPLALSGLAVVGLLAYGHWRMSGEYTTPGPRVALIQGSINVELKHKEGQGQRILDEYIGLSREAVQQGPIDLMVWPETMFPYGLATFGADAAEHYDAKLLALLKERDADHRDYIAQLARHLQTELVLGLEVRHVDGPVQQRFNSAVQVTKQGELDVTNRYDKRHLVMFGEYIPIANWFPKLYELTPLSGGLTPGDRFAVFEAGGATFAPNVCFESSVPHLIRDSVTTPEPEPDVLLNLTNDGWFRGSSQLEMHLACGVFRAIECRKPFLSAANTGISAWIDGDGRIRAQAPKQLTDVIVADVAIDHRDSFYRRYGDTIPGLCLLACIGLAASGFIAGRRERRRAES